MREDTEISFLQIILQATSNSSQADESTVWCPGNMAMHLLQHGATWKDITCFPTPALCRHHTGLTPAFSEHQLSCSEDMSASPSKRHACWYRLLSWGDQPAFPSSLPNTWMTYRVASNTFHLLYPTKALLGLSGSIQVIYLEKAPAVTSKCIPVNRAWKKICAFASNG